MRIIFLILIFSPVVSLCQNIKLSTGAGLPDLLHTGLSTFVSNKNEIGIQIGTLPYEHRIVAPTLEHRLYFRESKKFHGVKTAYFGQRLTLLHERSDIYKWNMLFVNLNIGRNMCLTENSGFSIDTGPSFIPYDRQFRLSDNSEVIDDSPQSGSYIFFNLRLQFFYVFK